MIDARKTQTVLQYNPTVKQYNFNFGYQDADSILVQGIDSEGKVTTLVQGSDYSLYADHITIAGGKTFDFQTLSIQRYVTPIQQETDFRNGDTMDAEIVERSFDYLTMIAQQMSNTFDKTVQLPLDEFGPVVIPTKEQRKGNVLGFAEDGVTAVMYKDPAQHDANAQEAANRACGCADRAAASEREAKAALGQIINPDGLLDQISAIGTGADSAKTAAEDAQRLSEQARDTSVGAKNDIMKSGGLLEQTQEARDTALAAKKAIDEPVTGLLAQTIAAKDTAVNNANTAHDERVLAETAKTGAVTAKTNAETAKTQAESARDTAHTYATTATDQAGIATTKATEASDSATLASNKATVATTKAGEAATSELRAKQYAENAQALSLKLFISDEGYICYGEKTV